MFNRRIALTAVVVALAAVFVVPSIQAGATRTTVNRLTFSAPVALPGVVLLPGRYAFEAGAWNTAPGIVRVTSADHQKLYYVGFTQHIARPAGMAPNEMVSMGEARLGAPAPIRAWYPIGSKMGHEFLYR
ncbi:MAG: hypothetical protein ACRD3C_22300 [Vicinamibacterales bacterium]